MNEKPCIYCGHIAPRLSDEDCPAKLKGVTNMKTLRQVVEEKEIPAKLIRAVIRQLNGPGKTDWQEINSDLFDINKHGIDGGFRGFLYTRDTVAFFKHNHKEILELTKRRAMELDTPVINMVAEFNCLGGRYGNSKPSEFFESAARCLYGRIIDKDYCVANALAWFAAEEVARAFCDE